MAQTADFPAKLLQHDKLGRLRGTVRQAGRVVQYRGLSYATIPARFEKSVLYYGPLSENEFEATKHGPVCPSVMTIERDWEQYGDVRLPAEPL